MTIIKAYMKGMSMLDKPDWNAVKDELQELVEANTLKEVLEEACDVLHCIVRLSGSTWLGLIVWPTASKHGQRVLEHGCPRSLRNHVAAGKDCCCM